MSCRFFIERERTRERGKREEVDATRFCLIFSVALLRERERERAIIEKNTHPLIVSISVQQQLTERRAGSNGSVTFGRDAFDV